MSLIDLNCDMGEGFGPWSLGDDAAMLELVSSANLACGGHAGDPLIMTRTMRMAVQRGVRVGAHPGFFDLPGFGRRDQILPPEELAAIIAYQLGAAQGVARAVGIELAHIKLHGALANMASRDEAIADICFSTARAVCPDIALMVIAGTAQARAAARLGGTIMQEIFADRAYAADGTLVPRGQAGAVIHDPDEAASRVLAMLAAGAILPIHGAPIPLAIDTICVHGDTPGAVAMAATIRQSLVAQGFTIGR